MRQLAHLRAERSELESRIQIMTKDTDRLLQTSYSRQANASGTATYRSVAPEVRQLRDRLRGLISENQQLVQQARVQQRLE